MNLRVPFSTISPSMILSNSDSILSNSVSKDYSDYWGRQEEVNFDKKNKYYENTFQTNKIPWISVELKVTSSLLLPCPIAAISFKYSSLIWRKLNPLIPWLVSVTHWTLTARNSWDTKHDMLCFVLFNKKHENFIFCNFILDTKFLANQWKLKISKFSTLDIQQHSLWYLCRMKNITYNYVSVNIFSAMKIFYLIINDNHFIFDTMESFVDIYFCKLFRRLSIVVPSWFLYRLFESIKHNIIS